MDKADDYLDSHTVSSKQQNINTKNLFGHLGFDKMPPHQKNVHRNESGVEFVKL